MDSIDKAYCGENNKGCEEFKRILRKEIIAKLEENNTDELYKYYDEKSDFGIKELGPSEIKNILKEYYSKPSTCAKIMKIRSKFIRYLIKGMFLNDYKDAGSLLDDIGLEKYK